MTPLSYLFHTQAMIDRVAAHAKASNSEYVARMAGELVPLPAALEKIHSIVMAAPDPFPDSPDRKTKLAAQLGRVKVELASFALDCEILAIKDRLHEELVCAMQDLLPRLDEKTKLIPSKFDAKNRGLYHNRPMVKKLKAIATAIKKDDRKTLGALLLTPSALTGINPEFIARFMTAFQKKNAPDEFAEKQAVIDTYNLALEALGVARKACFLVANPVVIGNENKLSKKGRANLATLDNLFILEVDHV